MTRLGRKKIAADDSYGLADRSSVDLVPRLKAHPTAARRAALGLVLLIAFVLRVWNLNWDAGTHQHPDERYWSIITSEISAADGPSEYFDSAASPMNPYNLDGRDTWVYGTFPLFSTKAAASFLADGPFPAGAIVTTADAVGIDLRTDGRDDFDAGYNANLIGRLLSALIDTATVAMAYLLGRDLFDRRVGFVAATLLCFTPLHIQYAHFYGAEPWVTFLVTAGVWTSLKLARGDIRLRVAGLCGLTFGLAAASKLIALATLVVPAVAVVVAAAPGLTAALKDRNRTALAGVMGAAAAGFGVLVAAGVTYRVFQPYTFDGLTSIDPRFSRDLEYLEGVNAGGNVPWVIQWIGRTPLWFPLNSAFWWGMGPALGIAVVVGIVQSVADIVRRQRWILLLPLALLAVMAGLVSQQFNPLIRYLLPAYPTAVVLGAFGVVTVWNAGARAVTTHKARQGQVLKATAVSVVALTAFWGLAFVNGVYNTEHPRIAASQWMHDNLPEGASISTQIWDDALPLPVPGIPPSTFSLVALDPFQADVARDQQSGLTKVETFVAQLNEIDYVVEASNRIYDSVTRFPARYPSTVAYYDALFDGSLGFRQVAQFRNAPSLFGISLSDHDAEETFTVYDHPTVTIWEKTSDYTEANTVAILNPDKATWAPDLPPSEAGTNALLLRPEQSQAIATGPTFADTFNKDGPLTWVLWLLWLQVAALAVLPWTTALFDRLPDKGFGVANVMGFLTVGLSTWLVSSWGLARYSAGLTWVMFGATCFVGAALWRRHRQRMRALCGEHKPVILASQAVFVGVFLLALWMRSANPDLWEAFLGGEKPMELAYLTAIGRSSELPAPDPWFAGGYMNYYYFGWYLLSVPMRAMRVLPEVAFNLGVATYAALTAATAFSIVHNLIGLSRSRWSSHDHRQNRSPILGGLAGVLLLVGIGNLDAIRLHYDRLEAVNTWTVGNDIPILGHVITFAGGTWAWVTGTPLGRFDFFGPSRVNKGNIDITEFPYFTFLFGDLHPHLMGMAFVGLVVSLAVAHLAASRYGDRGLALATAVGLGLATGVVRVVNTWDLPSVAIITAAALVLGRILAPDQPDHADPQRRAIAAVLATTGLVVGLSTRGGPGGLLLVAMGALGVLAAIALVTQWRARRRLLSFLGHASAAAATHLLVFWPFLRNSETFDTGLQSAVDDSPLDDFFVHWGIFLLFASALVVALVVDRRRRAKAGERQPMPLAPVLWDGAKRQGAWLGLAGGAILLAAMLSTGVVAISLGGVLVFSTLLLIELRRSEHDLGRIVALGLFALAFGISGGVDLVTVQNDVGRMNTVFKFWLQAWQYFAFASGFAIWQVTKIVAERPIPASVTDTADGTHVAFARHPSLRTRAWGGLVAVALLAGVAYPVLGTRTRLETRFAQAPVSLNGLDYLNHSPLLRRNINGADVDVALADDVPLIEWYRSNVGGTPTQIEWSGALYDWTARIAIHTGLPAVIGWDWHQKQQRWTFQSMIDRRVNDVRSFFTVPDQAAMATTLRAYEVAYVTLGTQERLYGTPEALEAIETLPGLNEVFRSGPYAIYQVDQTQLPLGSDPQR